MKKLAFFLIVCISLCSASDFILCVDGGGSKTSLQVVNGQKEIVPLVRNGVQTEILEASGSNINTVGIEGVRAVFNALFEDVWIDGQKLLSILPDCRLVAGMSGAALLKNQIAIASIFEEWGMKSDHIAVMSDAAMALELVGENGIILISGTGSICFGKNDHMQFRVGGLGRILGDEGSGYQIGLQALQAGLAEEYGWGEQTSLTHALRELFNVAELKSLIPKVNLGEMTASKIATAAPLVFLKAEEQDAVAKAIVSRIALDLHTLLGNMLRSLIYPAVNCTYGVGFSKALMSIYLSKKLSQIFPF